MNQDPLALLLEFDAQVRRDSGQALDFLHRRDRRFALDCERQGVTADAGRWLAWLGRFTDPSAAPTTDIAAQQRQTWRRIEGLFCAAGAVLGIAGMAGLLFYDGGQRINITLILGFVALQLLLALFTTVQALAGWQPWGLVLRRLGVDAPGEPALRTLQPVLSARVAHSGGLCFAVTGLVTLLAMVVMQDLAFGWSTTLDTAAAGYHRLVAGIAAPWAGLWPAASPELALVEATRFFRAAPEPSLAPSRWGDWWPFVAMLWLTWVLLPRLALRLAMPLALRRRARRLLARHPGMLALRYRMTTPVLETGNDRHDAGRLPAAQSRDALRSLPVTPWYLSWAGAGDDALPAAIEDRFAAHGAPADRTDILHVGGQASLAADLEILETLARRAADAPLTPVLMVRAWEPPTGELGDFLETARRRWPAGSGIVLLPLAPTRDAAPSDHLLQPWLRFAERMAAGFVSVGELPDIAEHAGRAGARRGPP